MANCNFDSAPYNMGPGFGLEDLGNEIFRKFRWLFRLEGVSAQDDIGSGLYSLPPRRASRPELSWKEFEFQHLTETITYPFKPEWKPMNLTLFDMQRCAAKGKYNAVYAWLRNAPASMGGQGMYDPQRALWKPIIDSGLKRKASLVMLDGCGNIIEKWVFENCYPQSIQWGELEMDLSDLVTIEVSIKFDRAYQDLNLV